MTKIKFGHTYSSRRRNWGGGKGNEETTDRFLAFSFTSIFLLCQSWRNGHIDYLRKVLNENEKDLTPDFLSIFDPDEITEISVRMYKPVLLRLTRCETPTVGLEMIFESFHRVFGRSLSTVENLQMIATIIAEGADDPNFGPELDNFSDEFE